MCNVKWKNKGKKSKQKQIPKRSSLWSLNQTYPSACSEFTQTGNKSLPQMCQFFMLLDRRRLDVVRTGRLDSHTHPTHADDKQRFDPIWTTFLCRSVFDLWWAAWWFCWCSVRALILTVILAFHMLLKSKKFLLKIQGCPWDVHSDNFCFIQKQFQSVLHSYVIKLSQYFTRVK